MFGIKTQDDGVINRSQVPVKLKYKKIAFANQKGGVGKTTSAVNISAGVAKLGYKCLLVDADPQGNATGGLGISKKSVVGSTYDLLIGAKTVAEIAIKTEYINLSVVPATIDLVGAEIELVGAEKREYRLRDALIEAEKDYDFIFIDCPPSLGLMTMNALSAVDGIVVPLLCEYYSLEGLSQLTMTIRSIKKLYNSSLEIIGVIVNMYDGRLNLTGQVMREIKKYFADKLFATPVPRNVKLSEAPSFGMPIMDYDKTSKGAVAYEAISAELVKRCIIKDKE
ncbi:MAG: AAA family ATPase [Eubacteriales bacterium]|nr:AAA family ATPase [Eubacteriales bacterium]MDD4475367.1 AAA family ATPase [Eubacteriales bacterium]